jgi:hypothetical protein
MEKIRRLTQILRKRRSISAFKKDRDVEHSSLKQILEFATWLHHLVDFNYTALSSM